MGRELKQVPLDFDWPLKETWHGYLQEPLPTCSTCDGDGLTPEARAISNTFYPHQIGGPRADALAWHDKIGQAEVDFLIEEGRLRVRRDREWHSEPRTAAEVNATQRDRGRGRGLDGHDSLNRLLLVRFRCERLGIVMECPACDGHGTQATELERAAHEAWERTEPPEGEGFQLWETTSEGSPVSPVFATLDGLCDYAANNCTVFGKDRASAEEWRRMLDEHFVRSEYVATDGTRVVFL